MSSTGSSSFGGAFAGAFMEGFLGEVGIPGFGGGDDEYEWEWPDHELTLVQASDLTTDATTADAHCGTDGATSCVTFEVQAVGEGMLGENLTVWYADDWFVTPECLVNGAEPGPTPLAVGDVLSCYTYDEYVPEPGATWEFWYDYFTVAELVVS